MISVVTTTYNTPPDVLARTWASLKKQSHPNWEWVIWDDSTTNNVWQQVYGFAEIAAKYDEALKEAGY